MTLNYSNDSSAALGISPAEPAKRVLELDALRGLAALAVTIFHYTTHYEKEIGHVVPPDYGFPAGNYGVQLFFMISGFVIFMTLKNTRNALDFVVSRFSRLYPMYWTAILLTVFIVYTIGLPNQQASLPQVIVNFTMFQQILGVEHLDGSYWTLQVELFFYAQMLFWFLIGKLDRIHIIVILWLAIAAIFGVTEQYGIHISHTARELLLARHIPFFAIGIMFYRIHAQIGRNASNYTMIAACIATTAIARPHVYTWTAVACTGIFWLFTQGHLKVLRARSFVFLGTISYSLYLLHQVIGFDLLWQLEHAGLSGNLAAPTAVLLMCALASLTTFYVEKPANRWIRSQWLQFQRSRQTAPESGITSAK